VDLSWATEFEQRVLRALAGVRFGATVTYGELAAASGSPRAARAVGGALGKNRVPVLIPCHRVLASNGIGGFGGGAGSSWRPGGKDPVSFKRALLRGEGVDA
jgi:methylated-DNA-[protein]-cysteine S-methyltransferase